MAKLGPVPLYFSSIDREYTSRWLLNQFLERVKSAKVLWGRRDYTHPTIAPALLGEIKSQIEPKKASVRLAGGSMI